MVWRRAYSLSRLLPQHLIPFSAMQSIHINWAKDEPKMDIREKPASGKRHVLSYEAFNNYCKECPLRNTVETYPQVVVVECSSDRCVYVKFEDIWEGTKK